MGGDMSGVKDRVDAQEAEGLHADEVCVRT